MSKREPKAAVPPGGFWSREKPVESGFVYVRSRKAGVRKVYWSAEFQDCKDPDCDERHKFNGEFYHHHDKHLLDGVAAESAKREPDEFHELGGDEPLIGYLLGEEDADALAGKNKEMVKPLRKLAECVMTLPDCGKLLVALAVMRDMSAKRRTAKFDEAARDLLKRWGGVDCAVVDALPSLLVGKLCWRMSETHSREGGMSSIKSKERGREIARMRWQGKTVEEIGEEMGSNGDAVKKEWQRRQKTLGCTAAVSGATCSKLAALKLPDVTVGQILTLVTEPLAHIEIKSADGGRLAVWTHEAVFIVDLAAQHIGVAAELTAGLHEARKIVAEVVKSAKPSVRHGGAWP